MAHPYTAEFVNFCRKNIHIKGNMVEYRSLPICIIDCVYSLRAKYRSVTVPIVQRYANVYLNGDVMSTDDTISSFLERMNDCGLQYFADEVVRNHQKISHIPKEEICYKIATYLECLNINTLADFRDYSHPELLEIVLNGVKGFGDAGINYLFMLAGDTNRCKPDVHIHRCIKDACGFDVSNDDCQVIFSEAVTEMQDEHPGLTVKDLDFAVWSHYRV